MTDDTIIVGGVEPAECGQMLITIDADGTFEAFGYPGADTLGVDGDIFEIIEQRERQMKVDADAAQLDR